VVANLNLAWRLRVIHGKLKAPPSLVVNVGLLCISPHVELIMAPHAGLDTNAIKHKAEKDLLHLLEGVSKGYRTPLSTESS
jgi:hypothetical protein